MNLTTALTPVRPAIGGLPLETFIGMQQLYAEGHIAILQSLAREYRLLQDSAKQTTDLALRKASQPE